MKVSTILLKAQRLLFILATLWWFVSCTTTNDVTYFQDAAVLNGMAVQDEQTIRLHPEDKKNIIVSSLLNARLSPIRSTHFGKVVQHCFLSSARLVREKPTNSPIGPSNS